MRNGNLGASGDLAHDFSNGLGMRNTSDQNMYADGHEDIQAGIDFDQDPDMNLPMQNPGNKKVGMEDFPSLRDIGTYDTFTAPNIAENKAKLVEQIMRDPIRRGHLDQIEAEISETGKRRGTNNTKFSEISKRMSKDEACSAFMSLMVFQKAGIVDVTQAAHPTKFKDIILHPKRM